MKKSAPVIFTFKNRALGDAIISLGAIQYIKKSIPNAKVFFGVPSWVFPLFTNLSTAADEIIPLNLKTLNNWIDLYTRVQNISPDLLIELFQSGRGKKFGELFALLNNTSYLGNNHHLDDGSFKKSNIQRDIDGVNDHLPQLLPGNFLDFCPQVKLKKDILKENSIIFGIVATRQTKLWPVEHFHCLAKKILHSYPQVKIHIPVSNNGLDQRLKSEFLSKEHLPGVTFIETTLELLPVEIAKARLYIGNDTGIKHLAIALGLQSVSFFGPEPPLEWHPYDQELHPYYYQNGLECRTREAHFCGLSKCSTMICLNEITPDKVFLDIQNTLKDVLC
jgi:heptosyltransferase II